MHQLTLCPTCTALQVFNKAMLLLLYHAHQLCHALALVLSMLINSATLWHVSLPCSPTLPHSGTCPTGCPIEPLPYHSFPYCVHSVSYKASATMLILCHTWHVFYRVSYRNL